MNFGLLQIVYLLCAAHIIWSLLLTLAMTSKPKHLEEHLQGIIRMLLLSSTLVSMARILQNGYIPSLESVVFIGSICFVFRRIRKRVEVENLKRACH